MTVTSVIVPVFDQIVLLHNVSVIIKLWFVVVIFYGRLILMVTCFQVSRDFLVTWTGDEIELEN